MEESVKPEDMGMADESNEDDDTIGMKTKQDTKITHRRFF